MVLVILQVVASFRIATSIFKYEHKKPESKPRSWVPYKGMLRLIYLSFKSQKNILAFKERNKSRGSEDEQEKMQVQYKKAIYSNPCFFSK